MCVGSQGHCGAEVCVFVKDKASKGSEDGEATMYSFLADSTDLPALYTSASFINHGKFCGGV